MDKYKTLILKSSRSIGSMLVKLAYISEEQLDEAYQQLIDSLNGDEPTNPCLLSTLIYNTEALDENKLLKTSQYPMVDLHCFEITHPSKFDLDIELCKATCTFPFDKEEGYIFLASAYTLSEPVIEEWEKLAPGKIIWHATDLRSITYAFEQLEEEAKQLETK